MAEGLNAGTAYVDIEPDVSGFGKKVASDVEQSISKSGIGASAGKAIKKSFLPALATIGSIGLVAKAGFNELKQAEFVSAQTAAVLKSTGGAAKISAEEVDALSDSLLQKSGVDDEVIKSGANMLLTFTNVRNEVGKGNDIFTQATEIGLDMSVALGQDASRSALQLGKALNNPIAGVGALSRVGVQFTKDQKDMIAELINGKKAIDALNELGLQPTVEQMGKFDALVGQGVDPLEALAKANINLTKQQGKTFRKMTEGGRIVDAQKIILKELNTEFKGSAEAAGKTLGGQINILKNNVLNLTAEFTEALMPALMGTVEVIGDLVKWMKEHQTIVKILIGVIATLAATIIAVNAAMKVWTALTKLAVAATKLWTAAQWLLNAALKANPIGLVITALTLLGLAFIALWKKSKTFRRIVTAVFDAIKKAAEKAGEIVIGVFEAIKSTVKDVVDFVKKYWKFMFPQLYIAVKIIKAIISNFDKIKQVVSTVVDFVKRRWKLLVPVIGLPVEAFQKMVDKIDEVKEGAGRAFKFMVRWITKVRDLVKKLIGWLGKIKFPKIKIPGLGKVAGLLGNIPGLASGGTISPGGFAVVGEKGPELIRAGRQGATVFPNGMGMGTIGQYVNTQIVSDESTARAIGAAAARKVSRR